MSASFDYIPYEDIVWDKALGQGSFGAVYKGTYLGTDIAIKEVFPPKPETYDKEKRDKYFEREWRIMRECRHPNIVQFLGLAQDPNQLEKWLIVSEYIPSGNLRQYIQKVQSHPMPWRLRVSFAMDISRAVAYLHARKTVHRDLKPENLLVTSNDRIKVTDFGFARVTVSDDKKRLTLCGTEAYMSPEIMMSEDFNEATDTWSLGMIFIEIAARKVADSNNGVFCRPPPTFMLDKEEVRQRASSQCPPDFLKLALDCTAFEPKDRPSMKDILARLKVIESEVIARAGPKADEHIGSIRIAKKKDQGLLRHVGPTWFNTKEPLPVIAHVKEEEESTDIDEDEEEVSKMMLKGVEQGDKTVWRTARWVEEPNRPKLLDMFTDPGTSAGEATQSQHLPGHFHIPPTSSSVLTVKPDISAAPSSVPESAQTSSDIFGEETSSHATTTTTTTNGNQLGHAAAPIGPRAYVSRAHRFSMPEKKYDLRPNKKASAIKTALGYMAPGNRATGSNADERCGVCKQKIGRRPCLVCDDCSRVVHYKCSAHAPHDCSA